MAGAFPCYTAVAKVVPSSFDPFHEVFGSIEVLFILGSIVEAYHGKANPLRIVVEIVTIVHARIRVVLFLHSFEPLVEHGAILAVVGAQVCIDDNIHSMCLWPVVVHRSVIKFVGIVHEEMSLGIPEVGDETCCSTVGGSIPVDGV